MTSLFNRVSPQIIARIIINDIIPTFYDGRTTVFLVGASLENSKSMRSRLMNNLNRNRQIKVYFPEQLFDEEIYSSKNDLLSLENLLAESVDHVILCVESPGSFTELGAFVNHDKLRSRLIVVMDENKRKAKSFINQGPIKLMNQKNKGSVIWHDFEDDNMKKISQKIRQRFKANGSNIDTVQSLRNPIIAEQFLLTTLYCLGSVTNKEIITLIQSYGYEDEQPLIMMCQAAKSSLFYQRLIFLNHGEYFLTREGRQRLDELIKTQYTKIIRLLDDLRLEILNVQLRKKKKIIWQRVS